MFFIGVTNAHDVNIKGELSPPSPSKSVPLNLTMYHVTCQLCIGHTVLRYQVTRVKEGINISCYTVQQSFVNNLSGFITDREEGFGITFY